MTSSTAHCTSWGKGDDGKVLLTLSSVSKLVCVCVCIICIPVKCWKLSLVILDFYKVSFICGYLTKSAISGCPWLWPGKIEQVHRFLLVLLLIWFLSAWRTGGWYPGSYSSQVTWQMVLDSAPPTEIHLFIDGYWILALKWWGR